MQTLRAGDKRVSETRLDAGVTLLELIVVIIIMSLMVGLVAPRAATWMDNWKLRGAAERVAQTIRDARTRAIYEQRYYVVEIEPWANRISMVDLESHVVRQYELPAGIRVDQGAEDPLSPEAFRLVVSPSGGLEERTLRLRNRQGREIDVHMNFLLGTPGIEVVRPGPAPE